MAEPPFRDALAATADPTALPQGVPLRTITKAANDLVWSDGRVLVATWASPSPDFACPGGAKPPCDLKQLQREVWVTAVPDVQRFCTRLPASQTAERLRRWLGLRPVDNFTTVFEFFVLPSDLRRPCSDPDIAKATCTLSPATGSVDQIRWFNENVTRQSDTPWDRAYPWTRLGYAYDWDPASQGHIGPTEFVIRPNAKLRLRRSQATADYCARGNEVQ